MDSLGPLACRVFEILGAAGIPAEIIGGYALSHYGYIRNTVDIDVVVGGDYRRAMELLKDQGFEEAERNFKLKLKEFPDKRVDVLPAGAHMSHSPVANPTPTKVSSTPEFVDLQHLLAMKMALLLMQGVSLVTQGKNETDVRTLILQGGLPRNLFDGYPNEMIRYQYGIMWDELDQEKQEGKTSSLDESYDPFADVLRG